MARIERITVHAALADPGDALAVAAEAARRGDDDWAAWIEDHAAGRALVVGLELVLEYTGDDGEVDYVRAHTPEVWIETHADPPLVEEQVRQIASNDFERFAGTLCARGVAIATADLDEMYVQVRLDRSLREALTRSAAGELRPAEWRKLRE